MKANFSIEYHTVWGESLALVIDDRKYSMNWNAGDIWTVSVKTSAKALKDYGYIVVKDGLTVRYEWRNHSFDGPAGKEETDITDRWIDCPIPGCPFIREHQAPEFDRPGFRGAGTAVPVFSLRTEDDFGIGEFRDLYPLVDWAVLTGQCVIQLLPVTDTTRHGGWEDSYPYSPVSSFALHPLYVNLQGLGVKATPAFKKLRAELNALPELDYPRVFKEKMALVRKAFKQSGAQDVGTAAFRKFCKDNGPVWLDEYAAFCARRDGDTEEFWKWLQWHLDRQLSEVVDYARKKNVHFKGDLPIGVSSDSADAYWHPELFNLDSSAGAPPDFFSELGQFWGFPTYNWAAMAKDDYAWWKARLRHMARYFDAFRIDHILGFFRIWEIPVESGFGLDGHFNPALPYSRAEIESMDLPIEGLFHEDPRNEGCFQPLIKPDTSRLEHWQKEKFNALHTDFFYHRNDEFWRRNAMKKLPELLRATGMLACGEDLGMVPDCVNDVMADQRILSLEMSTMEKGRPWPYLSVCATSSHDMETVRMRYALENGGSDMDVEKVGDLLNVHLNSASMLAIFPIQDYVALDAGLRRSDFMNERINQPADSHHHWRYRIHFDLKTLLGADDLNGTIRRMLSDSERIAR